MGSKRYINVTLGDINITNSGNLTGTYNLTFIGVANGTFSQVIYIKTGTVTKLGAETVDNVSAGGTPTSRYGVNNQTTVFAGFITYTTGTETVIKAGRGTIYYDGDPYDGQTYIEDGFMEIRLGSITRF